VTLRLLPPHFPLHSSHRNQTFCVCTWVFAETVSFNDVLSVFNFDKLEFRCGVPGSFAAQRTDLLPFPFPV